MSKTNNYISEQINEIIKDTREFRAYDLGFAAGLFELYKRIKNEAGEEFANKQFRYLINKKERIAEYFNKLIELDKEPMTKADKLRDKLTQFKNNQK